MLVVLEHKLGFKLYRDIETLEMTGLDVAWRTRRLRILTRVIDFRPYCLHGLKTVGGRFEAGASGYLSATCAPKN